jgi:hypothetical protein
MSWLRVWFTQRYLHCVDGIYIWSTEGLPFISKHASCAVESLAADRAIHARQLSRKFPHKESYPGSPGWGLGHGDDNRAPIKKKTNVPDITKFNDLAKTRTYYWKRGIYFHIGEGPSIRWLDSMEKDIQILGIKDWRKKGLDKEPIQEDS